MSEVKNVLLALNQRPMVIYPAYRQLVGGNWAAAALLAQLLYWWQAVGGRPFHKTDSELMEELGLSKHEMETAKAKIKALGFVRITRVGMPAKTHYEIDVDALAEALAHLGAEASVSGNPETSFPPRPETRFPPTPETSFPPAQETNKTEKTTEKTAENNYSSAVLQEHVVSRKLAASAEQAQGQSESSEPSTSPQEQVEAEIQRRRERSTEQILRRRRAEAHRRVAEAVLAPGTEEARLLWARFVELTRRNGERSFQAWLDEQVRPELERLGPDRFRAALAEAVARASSPDVRSPSALIMRVLKDTPPPELGAPESTEDFFAWLDRHAGGAT